MKTLGITTTITIVLIILKIADLIDISWWWVISPLWIGLIFSIILAIILFSISYIYDKDR